MHAFMYLTHVMAFWEQTREHRVCLFFSNGTKLEQLQPVSFAKCMNIKIMSLLAKDQGFVACTVL